MTRIFLSVAEIRSQHTRTALHSTGFKTHIQQAGKGFTLIELIVVIGIIALLGLLMLPVMAGTADQSQRAKCQNNLRRIAMGVTRYAGDNLGEVFSAENASGTYAQIVIGQADATKASQAGIPLETNGIWTCPNRPSLPVFAPAFGNWRVGYQYFGGIKTWSNPVGVFSSRSPTNFNAALPHWALAADAIIKSDGAWGGTGEVGFSNLPPHAAENSLIPQGGNVAFVDGSVQWIQSEKMFFLSSWSVNHRSAYWYQDPKDFPATLKIVLPHLRFTP